MPELRDEWFTRLKSIEREYQSAAVAIRAFIEICQNDPTRLNQYRLRPADLTMTDKHLEATYIIRLYALFEAGLRSFWATVKDTVPRSKDLIDGVAARSTVPEQIAIDAHSVRIYRNSLVHEAGDPATLPIQSARANLPRFLARLPLQW